MYYFNQRYYDPELGRFITHDPVMQTSNPYQYCGNNPMQYIDPDGRVFVLDDFIYAAIIAAVVSAGINATMQYAMYGEVNWNAVARSAIAGAVSGGLGYGIGAAISMGTGVVAQITEAAIVGGAGAVSYTWASGIEMSQDDIGDTFFEGFKTGAVAGGLNELYKRTVGFEIDYGEGGPAQNKCTPDNPLGRGKAGKDNNNIGFAKDAPTLSNGKRYGADWFREDGKLSKTLNRYVPGANALAGAHDVWGKADLLYNQYGAASTIVNGVFAGGVVYGAFYFDNYYLFKKNEH